jgi:hypothetical protein
LTYQLPPTEQMSQCLSWSFRQDTYLDELLVVLLRQK